MNITSAIPLSYFLCLATGYLGIRLAPSLGLLDIPGGRRQHHGPVPKVGGLALIAAMALLYLFAGLRLPLTGLEVGVLATMGIIGFLDDCIDLRARWKAALGLIIAVLLAVGAVHHLAPVLVPYQILGLTVPPTPWIATVLMMLLVWCIPHAFNLIDGANGLATGFALVVVLSLWGRGVPHPILAGTLLAVLTLNWPKARLFLGDCGSLSIGVLLVMYAQKALAMPSPNHLLWLFAYPILDVSTVVVIRFITRQPVAIGDRNHFHFQINDRWPGLSRLTVPFLLTLAAMCGSEIYLPGQWKLVPCAGLGLLVAMSAYFTVLKTVPSASRAALPRIPATFDAKVVIPGEIPHPAEEAPDRPEWVKLTPL